MVKADGATIKEVLFADRRWQRILWSYENALAASRACPGVPLRDVFYIEIRDKALSNKVAHHQFARRADLRSVVESLDKRFPPSRFSQHFDSNMSPFQPRK